jgi:hypothetical protein
MSFGEYLFLQEIIRKELKEFHMSDLHRNRPYYEKVYSRRLEKAPPRRGGPFGLIGGAPAPTSWAAT